MTPTVVPAIFLAKDRMSSKIQEMQNKVARFATETSMRFEKAGQTAFRVGRQSAVVGAIFAAPLVLSAKAAIEFEDKMADVAKTTGMHGSELDKFGDSILAMSMKTRSSIDDIVKIAEIGGRLGISKSELQGFTVEANKFAVALGGDFSGGVESAITEFGKLKNLFKDTKSLDVSESLRKSGSAFNSLSAKGVNVEGLTDFSLRVGALPEVMRPTLASTSALGAVLQKSGVDSQIAASGFSNFIKNAAESLPLFAKEMGLSTQSAKELFNTDTAAFFAQFSAKMQGVPADELALKLKKLGLNSLEVQKAVGAMSGSLDTYNEFSKISNEQMISGTSILDEYNTKNNTAKGQIQKLKNTVQALSISMGKALLPVLNDVVESISPYIQGAANWIKNNKELTGTILKVTAGIAAASFAISGISFAVGAAQKAMVLFGAASKFALGPIGLIVAAVGTAAYIYDKMANNVRVAASSQDLLATAQERALDKSLDQRLEARMHFDEMRKSKQGSEEYKTALSASEQMMPGITAKYDLQTKSIQNMDAAQKSLNKSIMDQAMAEVQKEMYKEKIKEGMQRMEKGATFWDDLAALGVNSMSGIGTAFGIKGSEKWATTTGQDVMQVDAGARFTEADRIEKMMLPSPENSGKKIEEIRLVVNGQDVGPLGRLAGNETPVDYFSNLMPKTSSTR